MTFFIDRQTVRFVDDDAELREANVQSLELAEIEVAAFGDAASALKGIDIDFPGIVVSDIRMPRMDGLQLFARLREIDPEIPVILITGHADVPTAIGALKDGAFDFLTKPYAADHLVAATRKALETRRLVLDNRRLRAAAEQAGDSALIGDSPVMARLRDTIAQVARADIDVLVEGETGSGKELVAMLLHRMGPRRGKPFVAINCSALPEAIAETELFGQESSGGLHGRPERIGRIEASSGGTLFLDEIDGMALAVQAKMLRVLEEREVLRLGGDTPRFLKLRVIAAAKDGLEEAIAAGAFRQDLFYRLNVVRLHIPPLRERRADIAQLFAHFVGEAVAHMGGRFQMDDRVRRHLVDHDWPGNVRELRNFAFSAVLGLPHQSFQPRTERAMTLPERVAGFEAALIREQLTAAGGSIAEARRALGIPRKTLYDKMARHGIQPGRFRR